MALTSQYWLELEQELRVHDLKLRLGRDISLVSFGDSDLARFSSPAVTVVNRATDEMGHIAAGMLIDRISAGPPPAVAQKVSLPPRLIVRDSVQNLRGSVL